MPIPTDTELEILRALWELGPSTVKQVHQRLGQGRDLGYTTVLKMMQTMHDKGLLLRDDSERAHRYWPLEAKARTQKALLGDFLDRVFSGSAGELVQMALGGRKLSPEDRAELKALLEEKPK